MRIAFALLCSLISFSTARDCYCSSCTKSFCTLRLGEFCYSTARKTYGRIEVKERGCKKPYRHNPCRQVRKGTEECTIYCAEDHCNVKKEIIRVMQASSIANTSGSALATQYLLMVTSWIISISITVLSCWIFDSLRDGTAADQTFISAASASVQSHQVSVAYCLISQSVSL